MASAAIALEVAMDTIAIVQFSIEIAMLAKTLLDNFGEMRDERDKTMLVLDNTVDLLRNLLQYERSQIEGVQHQIQRIQSALEDLSAYMEKVTKGSKLRNVTRFFGASGITDNLRKKRDAVTMAFEAMNITMTTIRSSADVRRASSSIYDKEGRDFWITSFGDAKYEVTTREFMKGFVPFVNDRCVDVNEKLITLLALSDGEYVSSWDFNNFLNWFGPMHSVLSNFRQVVNRPWFVGDMDGEEAHQLLLQRHARGAPVLGSFVVRCSATRPGALSLDYFAQGPGGAPSKQKCLVLPRTEEQQSGLKFQSGETFLNLLDLLAQCKEMLSLDPSFLASAADNAEAPMGLSSIQHEGHVRIFVMRKAKLRGEKGCWLKRYVKLSGTTLLVYEKQPFFHTKPVEELDLRQRCLVAPAESSHASYAAIKSGKESVEQLLVFTFKESRGVDEDGDELECCFQMKLPSPEEAAELLEKIKVARKIAREEHRKQAADASYGASPMVLGHAASSPLLPTVPQVPMVNATPPLHSGGSFGAPHQPLPASAYPPTPQGFGAAPPKPAPVKTPTPVPIPTPAALSLPEFVAAVEKAVEACPYFTSLKGAFFDSEASPWRRLLQKHKTTHDVQMQTSPAYRQSARALHDVAKKLVANAQIASDNAWALLFVKLQSFQAHSSAKAGWWQTQFSPNYEVSAEQLLQVLTTDSNVSGQHASAAVGHLTYQNMVGTVSQYQFETLLLLFGLDKAYPNLAQFSTNCQRVLSQNWFKGYADEVPMRKAMVKEAQASGGSPWTVRLSLRKQNEFVVTKY